MRISFYLKFILALGVSIIFTGCNSEDIDKLVGFDGNKEFIEVPTPILSDLGISITTPSENNLTVGPSLLLAGTCGSPGKVIKIESSNFNDFFTACNNGNIWSTTLSLVGAPTGTLTLNAFMVDAANNLEGPPANISINRFSNACDSGDALEDTFANFSTGGDGAATPWIICTPTQFNNIRNYASDNFEIHSNLDYSNRSYSTGNTTFSGNLNGNNFIISNISINENANQQGLFYRLEDSSIENLNLNNINVTGLNYVAILASRFWSGTITINNININTCQLETTHATTGIAGALVGEIRADASHVQIRNVRIQNCTINSQDSTGGMIGVVVNGVELEIENSSVSGGSVQGRGDVGGLIGVNSRVNTVIRESWSSANITGTNGNIGGFMGSGHGELINVYSTGDVTRTGGNHVGGLIGYFLGAGSSLIGSEPVATRPDGVDLPQNCYASGRVNGGDAQYTAGLIGRNISNLIRRCYYNGASVSGGLYTGGLIGHSTGHIIEDVMSNTTVSGSGNYVAGLVGYITTDSQRISDAYTLGDVSSTEQAPNYIGGLVGRFSGSVGIFDSYARGNINALEADGSGNIRYIGGFAGTLDGAGSTVENSYATGNIRVNISATPANFEYVGGFAGRNLNTTLEEVYATGNLTLTMPAGAGNHRYVGGLVGMASATITNSYAEGNVHFENGQQVGGLIGQLAASITVSSTIANRCYALGTIIGGYRVGGFVGYTAAGSIIQDCFARGSVTALNDGQAGGFSGQTLGHLYRNYSTGNVEGNGNYVGGLDGGSTANGRDIIGNFAIGTVNGKDHRYVGGITGYIRANTDQVTDNFFTGTITGGRDVGGIVGYIQRNQADAIRRNYSFANVIKATTGAGADSSFGPVVGTTTAANGIESNTNFYHADYVPTYEAGGAIAGAYFTNQTPLTHLEMQDPANFTNFDFGTPVWSIQPTIVLPGESTTYPYPILNWFLGL